MSFDGFSVFVNKSPSVERLRHYGFKAEGNTFLFSTEIVDGQFLMTVKIKDGEVEAELLDTMTGEPYTLHLVDEASGAFIGQVRTEFSKVLSEIAEKCFETDVFQSSQTHDLIEHVRAKYGDEPEYLWDRYPENAVFRRRETGKWYGIVMTVARGKLGLDGEGTVEILDVRADPEELVLIVDNRRYFPGWHMNKRHWMTVLLDGTLPTEELFELIEESYFLATK